MTGNPMNRGPLRNGNPRGNPASAPRCGARTRAGSPCLAPCIKGRNRCRLHGGKNPGAPEGERNGNYRHGRRTHDAMADKREAVMAFRQLRTLIRCCLED